jgi:hypothetical protein
MIGIGILNEEDRLSLSTTIKDLTVVLHMKQKKTLKDYSVIILETKEADES